MSELILKFRSPITFEGKEYQEIDLNGLERLNAAQLKEADKRYSQDGNISPTKEADVGYTCILAHMASGMPMEFFDSLPARDAVSLKNMVTGFLFN